MNDLIKFISKSLEPFGYRVRPSKGLNLLKINNLEKNEDIFATRRAFDKASPNLPEGNLDKLIIYLRTCMREKRNIDATPRLTGADLTEHSLRCIYSLLKSADAASTEINIEFRILDDRSDEGPLKKLKALLKNTKTPYSIQTTKEKGQGSSLHEQFSSGRNDDAIVYFCEDDYLHEIDGITKMIRFYRTIAQETVSHLILYPQEHNSLYSHHYPSYLVLGEDRHWRSVRHATHTFLTHGKIVEKYWKWFKNTKFVGIKKKRKKGSEARTTNNLFKYVPGFSPLKPCAVHLQFEELLPPYYDWRPLWDECTLPSDVLSA